MWALSTVFGWLVLSYMTATHQTPRGPARYFNSYFQVITQY